MRMSSVRVRHGDQPMQDFIYSQFKLAYKIIKTKPTPSYEELAGLIGMIVKHSLSSTISNWKKLELFCTVIIEQLVTLKMITIGGACTKARRGTLARFLWWIRFPPSPQLGV